MPVPFDAAPRVLPPMPFCGGIGNPIHPHDYQKWVVPYNEAWERNRVEAEALTKACRNYLLAQRILADADILAEQDAGLFYEFVHEMKRKSWWAQRLG